MEASSAINLPAAIDFSTIVPGERIEIAAVTTFGVVVGVSVLVYRLDDRLLFANAQYVRARILEALDGATTRTRWLVFDAEGVPSIDATGTEMLELLLDQLATMHIDLAVARAKGPLLDALESAGLSERIDASNFFPNVEAAVAACALRIVSG